MPTASKSQTGTIRTVLVVGKLLPTKNPFSNEEGFLVGFVISTSADAILHFVAFGFYGKKDSVDY